MPKKSTCWFILIPQDLCELKIKKTEIVEERNLPSKL